jgi:hypothetical protein
VNYAVNWSISDMAEFDMAFSRDGGRRRRRPGASTGRAFLVLGAPSCPAARSGSCPDIDEKVRGRRFRLDRGERST